MTSTSGVPPLPRSKSAVKRPDYKLLETKKWLIKTINTQLEGMSTAGLKDILIDILLYNENIGGDRAFDEQEGMANIGRFLDDATIEGDLLPACGETPEKNKELWKNWVKGPYRSPLLEDLSENY